MTWGGGKPHAVGDRGQRYEVTYRDPEQDQRDFEKIAEERGYSRDWINVQTPKRRVLGWSSTMEGAESFCAAIDAHPVWCDPQIRDRWPDNPTHEGVRQSYLKVCELSLKSGLMGDGDKSDILELYEYLWPNAPSDVRVDALRSAAGITKK